MTDTSPAVMAMHLRIVDVKEGKKNMRKTYRISVFNRTTGKREIMYERYKSKKVAQEMADKMNAVDPNGVIDARVIEEVK